MKWLSTEFPPEFLAEFRSLARPGVPGRCWVWAFSLFEAGYGRFSALGCQSYAHRVSYAIANGGLPPGVVVRHKCDNPPCWNPDHLVVGTHADNAGDAVERDRICYGDARRIKLTSELAREIFSAYSAGETIKSLCERYDVRSSATIHRIVTRKLWRRATADLPDHPAGSRAAHGEAHPQAKVTWDVVEAIRRDRAAGVSRRALCERYGLGRSQVARIETGESWPTP
jgi:hypothetical protein